MRTLDCVSIYENGKAKTVSIFNGEQIKLQAIGSGSASLKGRLSKDCNWDGIALLKSNDFSKADSIEGTEVYMADCSGYSEITVDATGYSKIYAVILG